MIGLTVKALREDRRWSQNELARRAGMKSAQISLLESGSRDNPTWETIQKLAIALGVSPAELIAAATHATSAA